MPTAEVTGTRLNDQSPFSSQTSFFGRMDQGAASGHGNRISHYLPVGNAYYDQLVSPCRPNSVATDTRYGLPVDFLPGQAETVAVGTLQNGCLSERGDDEMYVMQISAHRPDDCPAFNKESKKAMMAVMQQVDSLLPKYGIKLAGMWTDLGAHTIYNIYEAPGLDAYWAFLNEPDLMIWLSFNKVENKVLVGAEEVKAILARN
jgi:hypothetical protein